MSIIIYTTQFCPYCIYAKYMLGNKGIEYKEIAVDGNPSLRQEMMEKSGRNTVPQIWINEEHIGGCDELIALQRSGDLDKRLK